MNRRTLAKLCLCTSGILLAEVASQAHAQLVVTGNLSNTAVTYGSNVPGTGALATQTINTSFGDNTSNTGSLTGSELDASYGVVENGYLYLFFAGNLQNNGNALDVWIDDGAANGQTTLNAATSAGNMKNANGSTFSPGFSANYGLEMNTTGTTSTTGPFYVDQYSFSTVALQNTATYLGTFNLTGGVGSSTEAGSTESTIRVGVTNTNTGGVVGDNNGGAANQTDAQAVGTGIELGIPMAALGNPTGNIEVLAGINGNGDTGYSNQFLPGLAAGTTSVKKSGNPYFFQGGGSATVGLGFNFANTANEFFTVSNTVVVNGNWLPTGGGNWSGSSNWSNAAVPNAVGATANFSTATAPSTVTVDGNYTVGMLSIDDANSYTIAANPGDGLTIDNGGITATAQINDFGGVHYISSPVVLNSNTIVTCENHGDALYMSGNITGQGGLTVSNSGIYMTTFSALVLGGTNTYSGGTSIQRGELQLASAGALPVGTALSMNAASPHAVLDLNNYSATLGSLSATAAGAAIVNSSTVMGTSTLTYAGSISNPSTFPGSISDNSASNGGAIALAVTSGSLTLTGANTCGGGTTISSGATLTTAAAMGTAFPSAQNAVNNGSFVISDTVNAAAISGSGTTTVNTTGSLTAVTLNQGGLVNNGTVNTFANSTVGPMSGSGTLNVSGGTFQLAQGSGVNTVGSLTIGNSEALDITNNALIINYGSGPDPISSIVAMIVNGYANDTWSGTAGVPSILSTNAQNNFRSYGIGYADAADPNDPAGLASGEIELRYTLLGDANLDGKVNGADFTLMAANFNDAVTNGWDEGDFNYDGAVNGEDFVILADNFNQFASQSAVSAADMAALNAFAVANGINLSGTSSVPEPATASAFILASAGCLIRRRARQARA